MVFCCSYGMDLVPTDMHWNLADTGWAKSAWGNVFAPWINGSCVFIHSLPKFDPGYVLKVTPQFVSNSLETEICLQSSSEVFDYHLSVPASYGPFCTFYSLRLGC